MKFCLSEVERQEMELAKADQFPDNAITEPLMMRAQIINTYNNAMETEERVETLLYEEGLLREERKLLKRDYSRLPTAEVGCTIIEYRYYSCNLCLGYIFEYLPGRFLDSRFQCMHTIYLLPIDNPTSLPNLVPCTCF